MLNHGIKIIISLRKIYFLQIYIFQYSKKHEYRTKFLPLPLPHAPSLHLWPQFYSKTSGRYVLSPFPSDFECPEEKSWKGKWSSGRDIEEKLSSIKIGGSRPHKTRFLRRAWSANGSDFFSFFFFFFSLHHLIHIRRGKGLGCREEKKKRYSRAILSPLWGSFRPGQGPGVKNSSPMEESRKDEGVSWWGERKKGEIERQRGEKWGFRIKIIPSTKGHVGRSFLFFWYPVLGALGRPWARSDTPVSIRACEKPDLPPPWSRFVRWLIN